MMVTADTSTTPTNQTTISKILDGSAASMDAADYATPIFNR